MRRRPSVLVTGTAAALIGVLVGASSAQVNAGAGDGAPQRVTLLSADRSATPKTSPTTSYQYPAPPPLNSWLTGWPTPQVCA